MSFTDLVRNRYSCRKYLAKKPSREQLLSVLDVARLAPSAKNLQPWKYVIIDDDEVLENVRTAYPREWMKSAPAVIVVCGDKEGAWERPMDNKVHTDVDVAITVDHLTLAATDQGLATCWVCYFDPKDIRKILDIPKTWEAIALIPIGFPEDKVVTDRHAKLRKSLDELVAFNRF